MQINVIQLPAEILEFGKGSSQVVHMVVSSTEAAEIMEALTEGSALEPVRKLYAALAGMVHMSHDDYGHC